jgi:hypothetical protein
MGLGLAFCAIGQELADAGRWDPTSDEVEQLFEETARAKVLAGNVVRIMSDLRWVCAVSLDANSGRRFSMAAAFGRSSRTCADLGRSFQ